MSTETKAVRDGAGDSWDITDAPPTLTGTIAADIMGLPWAYAHPGNISDDDAGEMVADRHGQVQEIVEAAIGKFAAPSAAGGGEIRGGVTMAALQRANVVRQAEWCAGGDSEPDLAFRGNELAGETGEACNVIKKLERERHGWRGSRATKDQLAEELADVVICASLCAVTAGIDLDAALVAKFNATSEKQGLATRLPLTGENQDRLIITDPGSVRDNGADLAGLSEDEGRGSGLPADITDALNNFALAVAAMGETVDSRGMPDPMRSPGTGNDIRVDHASGREPLAVLLALLTALLAQTERETAHAQ